MIRKFLLLAPLALFLLGGAALAQTSGSNMESQLNKMYNRLMSVPDEQKFLINDSILFMVDGYAKSDSVFDHKFNNLRFLGEIISSDKKVKIITWNVMDSQGGNSYYCYFIRNNGKTNSVYKLEGKHKDDSILNNILYNTDNWYGALYYAIQPFKIKGEEMYMVLGYDYKALGISRKIIDILTFPENGEPQLGKGVLEREEKTLYRDLLEYSSDGVVSLRFNSKKAVIFDHLASFSDTQEGSPEYQGSALTFDAYILEKGVWKFYSNVDIRNED